MDTPRQPRQRSRDPLDRRFDQWIETGRQLVDGVAGTRPGQRGSGRTDRRSTPSLGTVGRWVGDKIDWILEEDEDWLEPWQAETQPTASATKRPLEAISRRAPPVISPASTDSDDVSCADEWPDESSFQVDHWQRQPPERITPEAVSNSSSSAPVRSERPLGRRPLPRSSRRRD